MQIEFENIALYIGNLCAAAKYDLEHANSSDVVLNGMSIVGWRQAYLEGCKDMAEGILERIHGSLRQAAKKSVIDAFNEKVSELNTANTIILVHPNPAGEQQMPVVGL